MPTSIELPVLETPPHSEVMNFGGGSKVAVITLTFDSLINDLKGRLQTASEQGTLSNIGTYNLGGSAEFTVKVEKLESPVEMTYKDHIRPGQLQFAVGGLAEEVLE